MKLQIKILALIFWTLLLFVLMTWPMTPGPADRFTIIDKVEHFILFGIFSLLISEVLYGVYFSRRWKFSFLAIIVTALYSHLAEYLQNFIPGRTPSWADFTASLLGAIFFVGTAHYWWKRKPALLLHICCIGCGAYVAQELQKEYNVVLYFFNPNIFPQTEYKRRIEEIIKVVKKFDYKIHLGEYDHDNWLKITKGLESEPEKGKRCLRCFEYRLENVAEIARKKKFDYIATTLTISPHKISRDIIAIGNDLAFKYGVKMLDQDFKKNDGYKKSAALAKELDLYRQNYFGCEYSVKKGDRTL